MKLATAEYPEVVQDMLRTATELKDSPFVGDFKREQREILESAEGAIPKVAKNLGMSLGEFDTYVSHHVDKTAANMGFGATMGRAGAEVGLNAIKSIAQIAMSDLYNHGKGALTEKRNFERMMKENPDLHEIPHDRVKSLFKTLHRLGGTELSGDPNVAGTFVRGNSFSSSGIDMKGVESMIGARSNLRRGMDQIDLGQGTPGLGLLQRQQEEEKNTDLRNSNREQNQLGREQFDHRKTRDKEDDRRYGIEDNRRAWEHDWKREDNTRRQNDELRSGERHGWDHRDQQRKEKEHRQKMHLGGQDERLKSLDLAYKYINKPPNRHP